MFRRVSHTHTYIFKANATAASPLFFFVGGRFTVRQPSRGVVLGHLGGILEASRGILGAGLSYNRGFGMKSSDVSATIAVFAGPKG